MEESVPPSSTKEGTNDSIEEVRDLLFGKRTAEISVRIEETEHSLRDAIYRMEERVECKLGVLENLIEDQMNSLGTRISNGDNRLKAEAESRAKMGDDLRISVEKVEASLIEKLHSIESRFHKFETIIWNEMNALSRKQGEELSSLKRELHKRLDTEVASIEDKSMDLTKLGEFLIDLGLKIQPVKDLAKSQNRHPESQPELAG